MEVFDEVSFFGGYVLGTTCPGELEERRRGGKGIEKRKAESNRVRNGKRKREWEEAEAIRRVVARGEKDYGMNSVSRHGRRGGGDFSESSRDRGGRGLM